MSSLALFLTSGLPLALHVYLRCPLYQTAACVSRPVPPGVKLTPLKALNPGWSGLASFGGLQKDSSLLILPEGEVTSPNLHASSPLHTLFSLLYQQTTLSQL